MCPPHVCLKPACRLCCMSLTVNVTGSTERNIPSSSFCSGKHHYLVTNIKILLRFQFTSRSKLRQALLQKQQHNNNPQLPKLTKDGNQGCEGNQRQKSRQSDKVTKGGRTINILRTYWGR